MVLAPGAAGPVVVVSWHPAANSTASPSALTNRNGFMEASLKVEDNDICKSRPATGPKGGNPALKPPACDYAWAGPLERLARSLRKVANGAPFCLLFISRRGILPRWQAASGAWIAPPARDLV